MPKINLAKNISIVTSPKLLMLSLSIGAPLLVHQNYVLTGVMAFVMLIGFSLLKTAERRIDTSKDNCTFSHVSARRNRYFGYMLGIIIFPIALVGCYLAGYAFDMMFYGIVLAVLMTMFGLTAAFRSRISLHTAVAGLFIFYVTFSISNQLGLNGYAPVAVLILYPLLTAVVGWARVQLGKHTWEQIYLAFCVTAVWLGIASLCWVYGHFH